MDASSQDPPVVLCRDLSARTRLGPAVRVLDGVSLALRRGEALAVVGPTGAGKSALLEVLSGARPSALRIAGGEARVAGIDVRRPGRRRRELTAFAAVLRQGAGGSLDPQRTAGELIVEPIRARDRRAADRTLAARAAALLDELGLAFGVAERHPHELSAGMRQRVALARALVMQPRVLLADEPLAGLDGASRSLVTAALARRRAEAGLALLLVAGDRNVAAQLDARVLALVSGRVGGVAEFASMVEPPRPGAAGPP